MKFIIFAIANLLLALSICFAESIEMDLNKLTEGKYILTYEEHYYDGIGESILTIEKLGNGYLAVWKGITDTTKVYTNSNFNTQKMVFTDIDTKIVAERYGSRLKVNGVDQGKLIEKKLSLKAANWYQVLSFSLIPFTISNKEKINFALFDPYNIKIRNMKIEKKETEIISVLGKDISAMKMSMRMGGLLSPFWKSELWNSKCNGVYLKYEGLNVIPSFYTAKIILKKIEFQKISK